MSGDDIKTILLKMINEQMQEMGRRIEQFAGAEVCKKVMNGSAEVPATADPVKGALGLKEAIDRLDILTDKKTREKILTACGCTCQARYDQQATKIKKIRQKYATEEEFLANLQPPDNSIHYERIGNDLIQYHTPRKADHGMRCSCYLMAALPEGVNASPTFCQCSRAYTQAKWESILGRGVRVDVKETAITGAEECKFIIHL